MFQSTTSISSSRFIDPNAIDITSVKGQFAWEKILQSDIYMPVIFRGDTKYFCVRMLRKILPDYPEDILRRSFQYQYRKSFDLYSVTAYEVELLNRINSQHSRCSYSRQPFTALDEIVRVSDFLPYYEHLHQSSRPAPVPSNITLSALCQLLPQHQQQLLQRSSEYLANLSANMHNQSNVQKGMPVRMPSLAPSTNVPRDNATSMVRPLVAPTPTILRAPIPPKPVRNPYTAILQSAILRYPSSLQQQQQQQSKSIPPTPNNTTSPLITVPSNNTSIVSSITPVSLPPPASSSSSSSSSSPPLTVPQVTSNSSPPPMSPVLQPSTRTTSNDKLSASPSTKPSRLHCGWLQINKLYAPYISTSAVDHHLYKVPVSLISHYHLLKSSTSEDNESIASVLPFEQTLVTAQEIKMINDLCIKQNIAPFAIDTKLIQLSTFYHCCSANILFMKELPTHDPKASICKDWSSVVQINGGICRLRSITTLHEQTVPFIGTKILKSFILSSQCLSSASMSKPTTAEIEFLQLILFFSNIAINLPNAQLIDIESVRKEYNVDLILYFNDKFPLNVLNYQQQNKQSNTSQELVAPVNSVAQAAATNTIAESTPPPSPPSPVITQPKPTTTTPPPLVKPPANRYYRNVEFHGHSLTAYICSGLGTNVQRECVAIRSLCNILYPNSTSIEQLEGKMLRLLRLKNVNRFRPQNQQSMSSVRLIDIKDAEKHWDYLEKEMREVAADNVVANTQATLAQVSDEIPKASTVESVENDVQPSPVVSVQPAKGEKRLLDPSLDDEDTPISERLHKRVRLGDKENDEQLMSKSTDQMNSEKTKTNSDQSTDKPVKKRTIKLSSAKNIRKRSLPSTRTNRQSKATWVSKYNIEDCCITLNQCHTNFESRND